MQLVMANQGGNSSSGLMREYRRGNWTVQETMVLIEAKKMDDERRMKRAGDSTSDQLGRSTTSKPTELRWKWIEDYCWRNGCMRSQNQCNDKWDNLMRDFKKVRDYERRLLAADQKGGDHESSSSYWKIERSVRKERNLPSNMLPQIYEALVEVVERKGVVLQRAVVMAGGGSNSNTNRGGGGDGYVMEGPTTTTTTTTVLQPSLSLLQHTNISGAPVAVLPVLPPPPPSQPHPISYSQPLPASDSDTSEYSDSPAKRRRRRRGEGSSGGTTASGSTTISNEVSSAISRSATIIAEAIQASEEREERRHKDLLSLHERRLQIEESKTEINRQGINGLVDAVNKLANSIFTLATHKVQQSHPPK